MSPSTRSVARRSIRGAVLIVGLAGAVACRSIPTTHYYVLEVPGAGAENAVDEEPKGWNLGVAQFTVDPPYDQDQVVYRAGGTESEVGFYAYHRWASPLERLLQTAVARALSDTTGVAAIAPRSSGGRYDAVLGGRLLYLDEVDSPGGPRVRVALRLELSTPDGAVLWSDAVIAERAVGAQTVQGVVQAMSAALVAGLEQLRPGLAASLASAGHPGL